MRGGDQEPRGAIAALECATVEQLLDEKLMAIAPRRAECRNAIGRRDHGAVRSGGRQQAGERGCAVLEDEAAAADAFAATAPDLGMSEFAGQELLQRWRDALRMPSDTVDREGDVPTDAGHLVCSSDANARIVNAASTRRR